MRFVLPFALSGPAGTVLGAAITAGLAAIIAIYLNAVGRNRENDARRRDLYSNAYRAALEWQEAVYRVRRRNPDGSQDYELVAHFHDLQERIAYYEGWLSIESASLGTAYRKFLDDVMGQCQPMLQDAWSRPGRPPTQPTLTDENCPDLDASKADFCLAVRDHLSPWWKPSTATSTPN